MREKHHVNVFYECDWPFYSTPFHIIGKGMERMDENGRLTRTPPENSVILVADGHESHKELVVVELLVLTIFISSALYHRRHNSATRQVIFQAV